MDLKILSIQIICNKDTVFIPLSNRISFIYGNVGVGKTTLLNLISYGLGNSIIKTQVVEQEVVAVNLNIVYNGELMCLKRKMNSNAIIITHGNDKIYVMAKGNGNSLTDFFYRCEKIEPIEMLRKKSPNEVAISFSNYLWLSYLRQEELDSVFFYLGDKSNSYKRFASEYVFKILLGERSVSEKEINKELRILKNELEGLKNKYSVMNELSEATKLIDINLSQEVVRKQKEIIKLKDECECLYRCGANIGSSALSELLEKHRLIGKYEAEIRYLAEFSKVKKIKEHYCENIEILNSKIQYYESKKNVSKDTDFDKRLDKLERIFLDCLNNVGFAIDPLDYITIDRNSFEPSIYNRFGKFKYNYYNLSSGGKKTIFKICYTLALHIYVEKNQIKTLLPKFIIIDTPMKNMSERQDKEMHEKLYKFFVDLFNDGGDLEKYQLVLVDKEQPKIFLENNIYCKHFSTSNPLIP